MTWTTALADVTINATNFPDANFRSYLLSEYPVGYITTAQLNARDTLYLYNKGISNMKGVEHFTELTYLMCYQNNLTTIDVSANTKLTYLNLGYNKLTSINVTSNTALEQLYLQNNLLTSVSVSSHSNLRTLWVHENPNLTGLYCWRDALTNVSVTGCTALKQLKIYNNYNLTSISGLADCTALTWLDVEDTSFGDLTAVKSMTSLETLLAGNTKITTLETSHSGSLTNLQVGGDTRLTELSCYSENLTTLKVTGCTALATLKCYYNANLTGITGLADCTALTYLDCEDCAITDLPGVNNMNGLQTLWARNNQLTELTVTYKPQLTNLRVSGNTGLTRLVCSNNALTSLNVTRCTALEHLDCQVNPSLARITGLTDCTALYWFACDYCAVSSLDMTFCPGLTSLYCHYNQLTELNVTGLTSLLNLDCMNNPNLGEITGLTDCTQLKYLDCSSCNLSYLNVDQMSNLEELWCSDNQFTELGVTNKPALTTLVASYNQMLIDLACYDCALTVLDVYNCSNLDYIDCENNALSELDLSTCPNLEYLFCNFNQLTELDITQNPKLLCLWVNSNNLTSLDLSHCSDDFMSLDCRHNQIAGTIDLSRFSNLCQAACDDNQISQLILGNSHEALIDLWLQRNQLSSINLSGCPNLKTLRVEYNQLTTIDASGKSALQMLMAQHNQLTSLNLQGCSDLNELGVFCNRINAGQMGQIVNALPTRAVDDEAIFYAFVDQDGGDESTLDANVMTTAQVNQAKTKNWNVLHYSWSAESWEPYAGAAGRPGDVNNDGQVTITDVTALIDYLLNGDDSAINLSNADVNGDSQVSIGDITALIDMLLNGTAAMMKNAQGAQSSSPSMLDICNKELTLEKPRRIKN